MGAVRDRMVDECVRRGFAERTTKTYVAVAAAFIRHTMLPPDQLGRQDVADYLLHLTRLGRSPATVRQAHAGLKFLFRDTLGRHDVVHQIPLPKLRSKLPDVPSKRQVQAVLAACKRPYDTAFFTTLYATGLRLSEALNLHASDIQSEQGIVRVRNGKGGKDRRVMLDDLLLHRLRQHWRAGKLPGPWLFPAPRLIGPARQHPTRPWRDAPFSSDGVRARHRRICSDANVPYFKLHAFRHAFASHLLDDGVDIRRIQLLLGHADLSTTSRYLRIQTAHIRDTPSPLHT